MTDPKIGKQPNGVSNEVYKKVSEFAAESGNKKKIDTQQEYDKLANYLSGNGGDMNKAEKKFIQEQLDEYNQATAADKEKNFMDKVTDAAKKLVERYAKGSGADDKKIDSPQEAKGLLDELENPQNDFNAADKEYIRQVVAESGVLPEAGADATKKKDGVTVPNEQQETDKVSEEDIKPAKPEKSEKPAKPAKPGKVAPAKPKYDEDQEALLSDMRVKKKAILKTRNVEALDNLIKEAETTLSRAAALNLKDTKEYKELDELCKTEKARIQPELDAKRAEKARKEKDKRTSIHNQMEVFLDMKDRDFRNKLEDAKKLLKEAKDAGIHGVWGQPNYDVSYVRLQKRIDEFDLKK